MRNPWEGLGDSVNAVTDARRNREKQIAQQRLEFIAQTARDMDAVEPGAGRAYLADQAAEIQAAQDQLIASSQGALGRLFGGAARKQEARNMAADVAASINSNPAIPYLAATGIRRGPGYAQTPATPGAPPAAGAAPIEGAPAPATPAGGYVSPFADYQTILKRGVPSDALAEGGAGRMPRDGSFGFPTPDVAMDPQAWGSTGALADQANVARFRATTPEDEAFVAKRTAEYQAYYNGQGDRAQITPEQAKDYAQRELAYQKLEPAFTVPRLEDIDQRKATYGSAVKDAIANRYFEQIKGAYGTEQEARAEANSFAEKQYAGKAGEIEKSLNELLGMTPAVSRGSSPAQLTSRGKDGVARPAQIAPAVRGTRYVKIADEYIQAQIRAGVSLEEAYQKSLTDPELGKVLDQSRGSKEGFDGEGQAFLRIIGGPLKFQGESVGAPAPGVRPPQAGLGPTSFAPEAGGSSLTGYTGDIRPLPGSEMAAGNGITMQSDVPRPLPTTSAPRFGMEMQGQTSGMADRFKAGLPPPPQTPAPATFADKRVQVLGEQAAETLSVSPGSATGKLINGEALSFEELQKVYRGLDDAAAFAGAIDQRGRMSSRETWEKAFREGTPDERRAAFQLLNENTDMLSTENLALLSPAAAQARIQERIAEIDSRRLAAIGKDDTALKVYEKQQEGLWKLVAAADEVNKSYGKLLETKDGTKNAAQFLNDTKGIREAGKRAQEVLSGMKLPATIVTELDPAWWDFKKRRRFDIEVQPAEGATKATSVGGYSGSKTANAYLNNSKAPGGR
jgi:hypothetical protein